MKKILTTGIISLLIIATTAGSTQVLAQESAATLPIETSINTQSVGITPRAEQFEWYHRKKADGTLEFRLWSITEAYWVTDWIDAPIFPPNI